jgi:hypothetical protein
MKPGRNGLNLLDGTLAAERQDIAALTMGRAGCPGNHGASPGHPAGGPGCPEGGPG